MFVLLFFLSIRSLIALCSSFTQLANSSKVLQFRLHKGDYMSATSIAAGAKKKYKVTQSVLRPYAWLSSQKELLLKLMHQKVLKQFAENTAVQNHGLPHGLLDHALGFDDTKKTFGSNGVQLV